MPKKLDVKDKALKILLKEAKKQKQGDLFKKHVLKGVGRFIE